MEPPAPAAEPVAAEEPVLPGARGAAAAAAQQQQQQPGSSGGSGSAGREPVPLRLRLGRARRRAGPGTPTPSWKMEDEGAREGPGAATAAVARRSSASASARQLGASLWEIHDVARVGRRTRPRGGRGIAAGREGGGIGGGAELDQPQSSGGIGRRFADPSMKHHKLHQERSHRIQPFSPASFTSSVGESNVNNTISPTRSLDIMGRSVRAGYGLQTSTELLKVLNRIWSLEEQHTANLSVVNGLKLELQQAQTHIQELMQERRRYRHEVSSLMRQLSENKLVRKSKDHGKIDTVVHSLQGELEDERRQRRHSEDLHRKLGKELSQIKSAFLKAVKDLEKEKKGNRLLEDLCDQFAMGIRNYEEELRVVKQRNAKNYELNFDKSVLHISEAWLDERMQMRSIAVKEDLAHGTTITERLSSEIEAFILSKRAGSSKNNEKHMNDSTRLRRQSLESVHLNGATSAPQLAEDDDDSVASDLHCFELNMHEHTGPRRSDTGGIDVPKRRSEHPHGMAAEGSHMSSMPVYSQKDKIPEINSQSNYESLHPSSQFILPTTLPCLSMNPLHILLALLLFASLRAPAPAAGATTDTLAAGQALAVGDKLVSRNGKFALGFFQPSADTSKSDNITSPNWYLGIWFNKIPVFTTVWVANREQPITDPKLAQLKISSDGDLVIVNRTTPEYTVWSTRIANRTGTSTNTTSAVLLDTGNLALTKSPSSSNVTLWQSFDYPTDVVLPGAKFGRNKLTGFNRRGVTRKSLIDPGLGSYSVEIDTTGVVLKHRNPSVVYWSWLSGASTLKLIPILKTMLEANPQTKGLIDPVYVDDDEEEYYMYTSLDNSSLTFVSLDISGQIKMNVWSQAQQSWQAIFAQPADPCTSYGTCGPFTTCNGTSHPFCECMESFSQKSPQDWALDDRTGGCIRNTPLHCTSERNKTSSTDIFHPIARVTLPYDPQSIDGATNQSKCEEACLNSCSCTAYSYKSSRCSVWHGELLSVNKNDGIDNNSEDVLYLRLAADDSPNLRSNSSCYFIRVIIPASIIGSGLLILTLLFMIWRKKFKWCGAPLYDSQGGGGIIAFRYTDLVHATKNFSEKLGAGGFGCVFKGALSDSTAIAVKRLDGASQGEKQFRAEVSSIGLIQHINLVKLIGFCCEGDKRLLVYEHMSNGSLDAHLFQGNAAALNWNTRYQIVLGVARGMSYLHQSCRECIIHCDIKPQNILLDGSFVPKIADFGMAAFVGRDFSRVLTTFRGTAGYLAPEWLGGVAITSKVDVYSFGMVLLEIISGRRNSPEAYSSGNYHIEYFPVRAISKLHEGDVQSLMDPQLQGDFNLEEAERVCKVGCWCIQDNELHRPTMGEVVRVLEGLQEIDMPPVPRLLAAITQGPGAITECSDASSV